MRTFSLSIILLSKHIDNPDAYPVQIAICLDESNWTKFKLCREEEQFKLKVDDLEARIRLECNSELVVGEDGVKP